MMMVRIRRFTTMVAVTFAPLVFVTLVSPGVSRAAECGQGTVYDAPSNTCVAAQQPPPTAVAAEQPPPTPTTPPPPPPNRGGSLPPTAPTTSASTTSAAPLERSHAVGLGEHLRTHSIRIAVHGYLGQAGGGRPF